MTWRGRLARAWIAAAVTICGCVAGPPPSATVPPGAAAPAPTSAAVVPAASRDEGADVARSQKPDLAVARTNSAIGLLGLPVNRPAEASQARPTATILAVVNGEPILDEEVKLACYRELAAARTAKEQQEIIKDALKQVIDREIVLQDALAKLERGGPQGAKFIEKLKEEANLEFEKRWLRPTMKEAKINSVDEFARYMREHQMSLDAMRRLFQRNFMAMQYLLSRIQPHLSRIGHIEIAEYYNSHREEFTQPDSVQWQDIYIDASRHASRAAAREFADSLARRARQGEDFAKLSAEFDNGTSGRFRKGDGQGHKHGEIFPREAEPILFQMHDGDIQIVERPRGFHVVRLVKRDHAGPIPFDGKVQKEIHDKLRNVVYQRERDVIVKELKRKAVIDFAGKMN
jgi:parvulin-like peptidyl-prolyl isomerase